MENSYPVEEELKRLFPFFEPSLMSALSEHARVKATLAVRCWKWVNEESEERTSGMNLLEAHGCGLANVRWVFRNHHKNQRLSLP